MFVARKETAKRRTTLRSGADAPRSKDNGASWSVLAFGAGWKPALQRRFAFWKLKRPFGAEQTLRGPKTTALCFLEIKTTLRGGADAPRSYDKDASQELLALQSFAGERSSPLQLRILEIKTTLRSGADASRSCFAIPY